MSILPQKSDSRPFFPFFHIFTREASPRGVYILLFSGWGFPWRSAFKFCARVAQSFALLKLYFEPRGLSEVFSARIYQPPAFYAGCIATGVFLRIFRNGHFSYNLSLMYRIAFNSISPSGLMMERMFRLVHI